MQRNHIINEAQLRKISEGCGFVHAITKRKPASWGREVKINRELAIIDCIDSGEQTTRGEISIFLDVSLTTIDIYLKAMAEAGRIKKVFIVGGSAKGHYITVKEES